MSRRVDESRHLQRVALRVTYLKREVGKYLVGTRVYDALAVLRGVIDCLVDRLRSGERFTRFDWVGCRMCEELELDFMSVHSWWPVSFSTESGSMICA